MNKYPREVTKNCYRQRKHRFLKKQISDESESHANECARVSVSAESHHHTLHKIDDNIQNSPNCSNISDILSVSDVDLSDNYEEFHNYADVEVPEEMNDENIDQQIHGWVINNVDPLQLITKKYAVVVFLPKTKKDNRVELVLASWLLNKDSITYCRFPPHDEWTQVQNYLETLQEPNKNWKKYKVEVISYAKSLAQGQRRLSRSYDVFKIESTDDEEASNTSAIPQCLSSDEFDNEMKAILPVSQFSQLPKDSSEEPQQTADARLRSLETSIKQLIEEKTEKLLKAIVYTRQNILYNIEHKIEALKAQLMNQNVEHHEGVVTENLRASLGVELPFTSLVEFLNFEENLKEDNDLKTKFTNFCGSCIQGYLDVGKSLPVLMKTILTKDVEMHYSGCGRILKGIGKRSFKATETFRCFQDVLRQKFGAHYADRHLILKISRWLTGASDRNGGRLLRKNN